MSRASAALYSDDVPGDRRRLRPRSPSDRRPFCFLCPPRIPASDGQWPSAARCASSSRRAVSSASPAGRTTPPSRALTVSPRAAGRAAPLYVFRQHLLRMRFRSIFAMEHVCRRIRWVRPERAIRMATVYQSCIRGSEPHERSTSQAFLCTPGRASAEPAQRAQRELPKP